MEALRKLEEVQKKLCFLKSHGLSCNDEDSDRFLAHFLFFMGQPCGSLNMERKCRLISENLPKMCDALPGDMQLRIADSCQNCAGLAGKFDLKNKNGSSLRSSIRDTAMVGLDAMQRAKSTLEDFCRSYFMFHGLDARNPQCIFTFLPVLYYVESYIYQLDSFNEEILNLAAVGPLSHDSSDISYDVSETQESTQKGTHNLLDTFRTEPFGPLLHLLEHLGLLTGRIKSELRDGAEYWDLERKLCLALSSKKEIVAEDVIRAIHLKSFDYRVLNLLLYQLRGQQVNELHMEFLSISEFLVEVSDDLFDYEDDVVANHFNILRMFVGLYGASTAPRMLAKHITEAEAEYESLSKRLDPDLSSNYSRRCEEATKEGGMQSGHALGTWNIPPVIADEDSYRARFLVSKSTEHQN